MLRDKLGESASYKATIKNEDFLNEFGTSDSVTRNINSHLRNTDLTISGDYKKGLTAEERAAARREKYWENPEKFKERSEEWRRKNPDYHKWYNNEQLIKKGIFPYGVNSAEHVWNGFWRSSQSKPAGRYLWVDQNGKVLSEKDYPRKIDPNTNRLKVNWGEGRYKNVRFLDTETGDIIKLDGNIEGKGITLEKHINNPKVGGSGAYDQALHNYDQASKIKQLEFTYQGKVYKLGEVIDQNVLKAKSHTTMKSGIHNHHPDLRNKPWHTDIVTYDTNMNLKHIGKSFEHAIKKAAGDPTKISKVVKDFLGKGTLGGTLVVKGTEYGTKLSHREVIKSALRKAGISLKSRGVHDLLKQVDAISRAKGWAALEGIGRKAANNVCKLNAAGGGAALCGVKFLNADPEGFMKAILQDDKLRALAMSKEGRAAAKAFIAKGAGRVARLANPLTFIGGEAWFFALDTLNNMSGEMPFNEAIERALWFWPHGKGNALKDNVQARALEDGASPKEVNNLGSLFDILRQASVLQNQYQNQLDSENRLQNYDEWVKDRLSMPRADDPRLRGVPTKEDFKKSLDQQMLRTDQEGVFLGELTNQYILANPEMAAPGVEPDISKGTVKETYGDLAGVLNTMRKERRDQQLEDVWGQRDLAAKNKYTNWLLNQFGPGWYKPFLSSVGVTDRQKEQEWLDTLSDEEKTNYYIKTRQYDPKTDEWNIPVGMDFDFLSSLSFANGGITTLARRPGALPPKRGPDPYGQKRKEGIVSLT